MMAQDDTRMSEPQDGESGTSVITNAMIKEEEGLLAAKNDSAKDDLELLKQDRDMQSQSGRMRRLNHLLQQSSAYSTFLHDRMKKQIEESATKAKRADKRKGNKQASKEKSLGPRRASDRAATGDESTTGTPVRVKRQASQKPVERKKRQKKTIDEEFTIDESQDLDDDNDAMETDPTDADGGRVLPNGEIASERQPKMFSGGALREYQLVGMEWLAALYENGLNGILADEMGLGKTIQCIAFFCHLYTMKVRGPYIVVGPLSTLPNWFSEFQRFAPQIPVILYHGTPEERALKRAEIKNADAKLNAYPVVITSYEIVIRDRKWLQNFPWKYVVVDEGHRIKNLNCRLIKELKLYRAANRLLLTGTPLQNNLTELWALLNFLMPDIFNDLDQFQRWFDFEGVGGKEGNESIVQQEQQDSIVSKLHGILGPFLLRRLKTDVELSIPDKKEIVIYAPLTPLQQSMYTDLLNKTLMAKLKGVSEGDAEVDKNGVVKAGVRRSVHKQKNKVDYREVSDTEYFKQLEASLAADEEGKAVSAGASADASKPTSIINLKMKNVVMQLRKCCNHPFLIEWPLDPKGDCIADDSLVNVSGKMMVCDRLLKRLKQQGHKVLIFSQFTTVLDVLEDVFHLRGYKYCRIDGGVPFEERREAMRSFNEDDDVFVFLLSTRAGGLGINLVAADTVIIYDSDWNPQADLQAQDRCHRIGQKNTVMVYRLITKNTIDQRILERAEAKRKLEKLVIHKGKFKGSTASPQELSSKLSPEELLGLLADNVARQVSADESHEAISDAVLDKVLDRSVDVSGMASSSDSQFEIKIHKNSDSKLLKGIMSS